MNYIIKCFVFSTSKKFKFEYRVLSSPTLLKILVRSSASSLNFSSSCLLTSIFGKFLLCCSDRFVSFKSTSFFFLEIICTVFFSSSMMLGRGLIVYCWFWQSLRLGCWQKLRLWRELRLYKINIRRSNRRGRPIIVSIRSWRWSI